MKIYEDFLKERPKHTKNIYDPNMGGAPKIGIDDDAAK